MGSCLRRNDGEGVRAEWGARTGLGAGAARYPRRSAGMTELFLRGLAERGVRRNDGKERSGLVSGGRRAALRGAESILATPAPHLHRHTRAPPRVSRRVLHPSRFTPPSVIPAQAGIQAATSAPARPNIPTAHPRRFAPPPHPSPFRSVIPAPRRGYLAEFCTQAPSAPPSVIPAQAGIQAATSAPARLNVPTGHPRRRRTLCA